jgi:hypothetical protein
MPTAGVVYKDIQAYLDAIADNPNNKRDVANSGHDRFWKVPYQQFISNVVPNEVCAGKAIKIVDPDPSKCPFYQSIKNPSGWCNTGQMPKKGPFITDPGYTVTLKDGSTITGAKIDEQIVWWLTNNMPEL